MDNYRYVAVRVGNVLSQVSGTLVLLCLLVPLLAFGGWSVRQHVADSAAYQNQIRQAQLLRSALMRSQVDEETGIRGYIMTRDKAFLDPYNAGLVAFAHRAKVLETLLRSLGRERDLAIVDEEAHINTLWLTQIAGPAIAHPGVQDHNLQLAGKALIDNFRERDLALTRSLVRASTDSDDALERALSGLVVFVVSMLLVLSIGGLLLAYFLSRSTRRAFETRVLYQNQKRLADSLQTAFLQKSLPMTPGIGLHAMYVPATTEAQVGGDWYDAFTLPDGRLLFSIGDVAGHGIEAAIVMSRARQAIVAAALQDDDPARVLSRANDAIILQDSRMVTAICGFIDPKTLEISYATAGHPPPVLASPGSVPTFLPHDGIPLGIVRGTDYRTFFATARHDTLVVFYTDGVIEHKRDIFEGERRLLEAVAASVGREDPAVAIHEAVFAGSYATDDVAIFTVTFRSVAGDATPEATVDALQSSRLALGVKSESVSARP